MQLCLKVLILVFFVALAKGTTNYHSFTKTKENIRLHDSFETFRLPNDTVPEAYDISLRTWINQGNTSFTGTVRIGIIVRESTNTITLHHRALNIESVRVSSTDNIPIAIGDVSYDSVFEFLTIPTVNTLPVDGQYVVDIQYSGTMLRNTAGFYAQSYWNGETYVDFASTQFESTEARRAFPCYDEPALKARFTIRITHDPSYSAVSNMPTVSENPQQNSDGSVTTEFIQSPLMSTYLVAFHVSDFAHATGSSTGIPQRIFAAPNLINQTSAALTYSQSLLHELAEYFEVEYGLPKLDQISLPSFGGAMENFGMVTYSDYYLVFDDTVDPFERKISSVVTIAHELAHMWFGNLVTPTWWSFVWMKEGFATLFQCMSVDLVYPDWNMKDFFIIDRLHYVLEYDSLPYFEVRPMTHYVESPREIDYLFDNIAYSKAGSVLRMFMLAFGEETFMRGVTMYLNAYKFSDASEENLFGALALAIWVEDESFLIPEGTNVSAIMSSWTRQPGYPLITCQRNYETETDQVTLSQRRYFTSYGEILEDNSTWWIPYNYATPHHPISNDSRAFGWMPQNESTSTITIESLSANDFLLLDTHGGGYYRILYDERNYRLISDAMIRNISEFSVASRSTLLDNIFEYAILDMVTFRALLDVLRILQNEDNYVTWHPVQNLFNDIDLIFSSHENHAIWRDFVRSLTERLYESVGVDDIADEPILRKHSRRLALRLACNYGSVHCRSDATRRLRQLISDGKEFHQNVRGDLYCAALRSANSNDFNFVWSRMLSSDDSRLRSQLFDSLSCVTSRLFLNQLLRSTLPSTNTGDIEYRGNEPFYLFRDVYSKSVLGMEVTLDFLIDNAVEAFQIYGGQNFLQNIVYDIARNDLVEKFRELLQIYLDENLIPASLIPTLENVITRNRYFIDRYAPVINQWLLENVV